jgi:hypothetical protein
LQNREHIVLSFKCKSQSRGFFFPFILREQFSPSSGKNCKIYKIDECLKLTNVTDPVGSSSLVGNSHYRAFVTNANAKCIQLGQHVRHCCPKEIHLQFHALFCQDMYLSFHSPVPIPSSVRTHEQGKVSVHSGLSSMLNDKKSMILDAPHSVLTSLVLSIVTPIPVVWISHPSKDVLSLQTCKDQRYTGSLFEHHLKLISCRLLVPLPNMPIKITAPQSRSAKSIYSIAGSYGRFLSL